MTDEKKRKIDAKQFVRDVEAGMHTSSLMVTYGLSPSELQRAFKKLEERGLLKPRKTPAESAPGSSAGQRPKGYECPSCGAIHGEPFDECAHCGVVLSKVRGAYQGKVVRELTDEPRPVAREYVSAGGMNRKSLFSIVGIGVVVLIAACAFFVHRSIKNAEIQSLIQNVQSVLNASNAQTAPNYAHLAQIFGDATGAMAAVLESRRTPYSEKMHELYQKLVYLGDLQKRTDWKSSGTGTSVAAYRNSARGAAAYDGVVRNQLDGLADTLGTRRGALAGASEGGGASGEAEQQPIIIPGVPAPAAPDTQADSTAAQFEKAQDELRSLCAQVLSILATQ